MREKTFVSASQHPICKMGVTVLGGVNEVLEGLSTGPGKEEALGQRQQQWGGGASLPPYSSGGHKGQVGTQGGC